MVIVSCSTKFHAFDLSEQLNKHYLLKNFYTSYAYQKNVNFRKVAKRVDKENIPKQLIKTNLLLAGLIKIKESDFLWNEIHDRWVAANLTFQNDYKVFIGWSSMSLHSMRAAKKKNKITILERGSSHILYQQNILKEEYKKFGIEFSIDPNIIRKEKKEYEEADYISIPSMFVKNSFLEMGVPESKLVLNNYGSSGFFKKNISTLEKKKFVILYLGSVTIQKGLIYFFEALHLLNLEESDYEVWFIGKVDNEMQSTSERYSRPNWKWIGFVPHYDLPKYINQTDIAVQPSLQEGLSMVIAQIMACGVPVIASKNTGGADIITNGENGFIVPIRSPESIAKKILKCFYDRHLLSMLKKNAELSVQKNFTWDNYGDRYASFIENII